MKHHLKVLSCILLIEIRMNKKQSIEMFSYLLSISFQMLIVLFVHVDADELVHVDRDFLCDLWNTNRCGKQTLSGPNESIDVVVEVLYGKTFVDMYHNDNRSDVQH
jgi:hypothetical protein